MGLHSRHRNTNHYLKENTIAKADRTLRSIRLRASVTAQGLSFTTDDRKALVAGLEDLKGFNYKDVAKATTTSTPVTSVVCNTSSVSSELCEK